MISRIILAIIAIFSLYKCTGGRYGTDKIFGPPDELPLSRYETMAITVRFHFPPNRQTGEQFSKYIGDVIGVDACGDLAGEYAYQQHLADNSGWSYDCCTHENGSECYREIR
jgi:hypothetical protein